MNADSWVALVAVLGCVVVLVFDRFPPVLVLGGAVAALLFTDVIDTQVALSGLSSPAPATIGALTRRRATCSAARCTWPGGAAWRSSAMPAAATAIRH